MRAALAVLVAFSVLAAACADASPIPAGQGNAPPRVTPNPTELRKYGDMPIQVLPDGSVLPDPNTLGIGPEGVPYVPPDPHAELRQTLDGIPSEHKLVLADGRVVGVMGRCGGPHDPDPTNKCMGLHDLETLAVVGVNREGTMTLLDVSPTAESTDFLQSLLEDPAVREQIVDFIDRAPPR